MLRASLLLALCSLGAGPAAASHAPALAALSLQATGSVLPDSLETPAPPAPSACVTFQGRVRYSLGYDHLVDVKNGCPKPVSCAVTTNVNREPITVSLKPTESTTVVTFIGSPAREFQPQVVCQYIP